MSGEVTPAELARSIARIEGKIDRALDDHEKRLRTVERWMWTVLGLSAAGAASGFTALIKSIGG